MGDGAKYRDGRKAMMKILTFRRSQLKRSFGASCSAMLCAFCLNITVADAYVFGGPKTLLWAPVQSDWELENIVDEWFVYKSEYEVDIATLIGNRADGIAFRFSAGVDPAEYDEILPFIMKIADPSGIVDDRPMRLEEMEYQIISDNIYKPQDSVIDHVITRSVTVNALDSVSPAALDFIIADNMPYLNIIDYYDIADIDLLRYDVTFYVAQGSIWIEAREGPSDLARVFNSLLYFGYGDQNSYFFSTPENTLELEFTHVSDFISHNDYPVDVSLEVYSFRYDDLRAGIQNNYNVPHNYPAVGDGMPNYNAAIFQPPFIEHGPNATAIAIGALHGY